MHGLSRPHRPDAVVAGLILLWELTAMGDDLAISIPAALLVSVPLAWQRTGPALAAVGVSAGFVLQAVQPSPPETLAELVALLLAAFAVAAYASRTQATVGIIAGFAAIVGESLLAGIGDIGFGLVLVGIAVLAGLVVRRRGAELEQATARIDRAAAVAAAAERQRIARELHDVVSHGVSLMVVHAGAAEAQLRESPETAQASLRRVQLTGRDAVDDLRRMLAVLYSDAPGEGEPQPSIDDLPALIAQVSEAGTPASLAVDGRPRGVPPGLSTSVYRVVQEALTNVRRHAPGAAAAVTIRYAGTGVDVRVHNDAATASSHGAGSGHGLRGASERAALYGGQLEAGPDDNGGWLLHATFPVGRAPA
jgi:signal transduction histidine kinase